MATDITINGLVPATVNNKIANPITDLSNTTFVGIDFGTSTTVVSIAKMDRSLQSLKTEAIWLNQKLYDGAIMSSEKIPTVIAWYNGQLLVGKGAADLKYQLKKGINVWYSFKMELGEDLGSKYYNSELDRNSPTPILNPKDAAKIFFQYLKAQIDRYIKTKGLPQNVKYAVSIPASFEANQRRELIYALEQNGISINQQSLIDEPNAAFLSYVQSSSMDNKTIKIPDGDNPKVLVFDFGAGTCDVSILELGKDLRGIYSKNLSISKFEKLGGDDIDRLIALDYLFPQLLQESGKRADDFRTPEKNRMITQLLKAAEQLKIMICESVALQMTGRSLPALSGSPNYISIANKIELDTRKGNVSLSEAKLSYAEFNEVMNRFLRTTSLVPFKSKTTGDEFPTILAPIQSALKKASLNKEEIDYVLLIGGSSKNPYVQSALKNYFTGADILIPQDLQTHVSAGAAIHSLVFNGFNKNIIQPITSEPLIVITKDETPKVVLKAGTHIPCDLILVDDLVTSTDGQQAIELPICLGNINKILYNIKIVSGNLTGFKKNTKVKLEIEITTDKLLVARASAQGETVYVEPLNPFANKELTAEQRMVLKAERQANVEAEQNGGKPTKEGLQILYRAYEKIGNYLRAAETLELLNELYPSDGNYNQIGVLFSSAGHDDKALEYYELGYQKNKNSTTAFNYAYKLKNKDKDKFKAILEESLNLDPQSPHAAYELGKILTKENDPRGSELIQKAFNTWKDKFDRNKMDENEYSWLSSVAEELGMRDFAERVRESKPKFQGDKLYNPENLTVTFNQEGLMKY